MITYYKRTQSRQLKSCPPHVCIASDGCIFKINIAPKFNRVELRGALEGRALEARVVLKNSPTEIC